MYRVHYTALYHYGHRITPDTELIRDSIQILFIDLWRRRTYLGDTERLRPYLYQGLRRLLIRQLKTQRETSVQVDFATPALASQEEHFITSEKKNDQEKKLQEAMQALSRKQQEVVYLRFYENLDNQTIAKRMDITVNTVYNLVSLALNNLRRLLKNQTDPLLLLLLLLI